MMTSYVRCGRHELKSTVENSKRSATFLFAARSRAFFSTVGVRSRHSMVKFEQPCSWSHSAILISDLQSPHTRLATRVVRPGLSRHDFKMYCLNISIEFEKPSGESIGTRYFSAQ